MSQQLLHSRYDMARHVWADTLEPVQQPTRPNFKKSTNFFQCCLLKHPGISEFHSLAELLHVALLEGDPTVRRYVPQPYRLKVFGGFYTPDIYVEANGDQQVLELKPEGKFDENQVEALKQFFALRQMSFGTLANETVFEQQLAAENWLMIVHTLHQAVDIDTHQAEIDLLGEFGTVTDCFYLGDIVDRGDRERTYQREIGLFRLLYHGQFRANLNEAPLDFPTRFQSCRSIGQFA
ncbi:MAG: hypothetical protein ACI90U_002666 [Pseudomonadales bacterium]|jgi:hypothetical protein